MARSSSFLPRIPFYEDQETELPLHEGINQYSLRDMSPRPDEVYHENALDYPNKLQYSSPPRSDSSQSPPKNIKKTRFFFDGPPPPIVLSAYLDRDSEKTQISSSWHSSGGISSTFKPPLASRIFGGSPNRKTSPSARPRGVDAVDTAWKLLQRREKGLHKDIQTCLDAQETRLKSEPTSSRSQYDGLYGQGLDDTVSSTENSQTPTASDALSRKEGNVTGFPYISMSNSILEETKTHVNPHGNIVPVRQPKIKIQGLRAARTGITRSIILLADLKKEEDFLISSAIVTRKKALLAASRISNRRDDIKHELKTLESDKDEPLATEIKSINDERDNVVKEIMEIEIRLQQLRCRKHFLEGKIEEVKNRREAGLSGYHGALREVEEEAAQMMRQPPVWPLDMVVLGAKNTADNSEEKSLNGDEFFKMRPERRTLEMAREWWEGEIKLLEQRKANVDFEREALEEGSKVWKRAYALISEYEACLRADVNGSNQDSVLFEAEPSITGKGKLKEKSVQEKLLLKQLQKMTPVIVGLQEMMVLAEEKNWTLLICALGAELEAFRKARQELTSMVRERNFEVEDELLASVKDLPISQERQGNEEMRPTKKAPDSTELTADPTAWGRRENQSFKRIIAESGTDSSTTLYSTKGEPSALDDSRNKIISGDHEVSAKLLAVSERYSATLDSNGSDNESTPTIARSQEINKYHSQSRSVLLNEGENSENEIPPEFLAQHKSSLLEDID